MCAWAYAPRAIRKPLPRSLEAKAAALVSDLGKWLPWEQPIATRARVGPHARASFVGALPRIESAHISSRPLNARKLGSRLRPLVRNDTGVWSMFNAMPQTLCGLYYVTRILSCDQASAVPMNRRLRPRYAPLDIEFEQLSHWPGRPRRGPTEERGYGTVKTSCLSGLAAPISLHIIIIRRTMQL